MRGCEGEVGPTHARHGAAVTISCGLTWVPAYRAVYASNTLVTRDIPALMFMQSWATELHVACIRATMLCVNKLFC